jgi:hypothetical protein
MTRAPRRLLQAAAAAVVLLLLYVARSHDDGATPVATPASPNPAAPVERPAPAPSSRASSDGGTSVGGTSVAEAFRSRRSNVEVEAGGRVVRVLPDDREGSRHERFLVRVDGETTVRWRTTSTWRPASRWPSATRSSFGANTSGIRRAGSFTGPTATPTAGTGRVDPVPRPALPVTRAEVPRAGNREPGQPPRSEARTGSRSATSLTVP